MWKNSFPYDNPTKSEIKRLYDSSNGLVPKWIAKYFGSLGLKKIKFLDVGCGYGYGFKAFFSKYISQIKYIGFDIHGELPKTYKFINKLFSKHDEPPIIVNANMNKIQNIKLFRNIDFAWAQGTLHHSKSVDSAIQQISKILKKNGLFMFWIINEQKPVRKVTDLFFRNYFQSYPSSDRAMKELKKIAYLSRAFGKSLGNDKVVLKSKIECLQIEPGIYSLQRILYDYIIKLYYYNKSDSIEKISHQLFDWFRPTNYEQTNKNTLKKILKKNNLRIIHHLEKVNGHHVVCKKF